MLLTYALKRLLSLIPIVIGVAVVTFVLILLIPGDPVEVLLPSDTPPAARAEFRHQLHLDGRPDQRFVAWADRALLHADLGQSISRNQSAGKAVFEALGNTAKLVIAGIVIALLLGVGAGMAMGWYADQLAGRSLNVLMVSLASVPQFWFGLILLYVFSVKLGWFPTGGMGPTSGGGAGTSLKYLVLPAITVALLPAAIIARLTRTLIMEIREQDFVTTLRTRGYSTLRVWRHVLRNAAPGVLNIIGLQIGYILLGTLFTEIVFSWPGIGTLILNSISSRDYPVIQATVLISGIMFAAITVLVDIGMRALDPRIQGS